MTTKGISQLLGNGDEEQVFQKELDILNKYNQLTGSNLEPHNHYVSPLPQKQAMAWKTRLFLSWTELISIFWFSECHAVIFKCPELWFIWLLASVFLKE